MSEPEAKLTAYAEECATRCQWCAKGFSIITQPRMHLLPNSVPGHLNTIFQPCTAPAIEQFAEDMAEGQRIAELEHEEVLGHLSRVTKQAKERGLERDQWRQKFEQRDRECKELQTKVEVMGLESHEIWSLYNERDSFAERLAARDARIAQLEQQHCDFCEAIEHAHKQQIAAKDQEIALLREALQGAHLLPRPWMKTELRHIVSWEKWNAAFEKIDAALAATAPPSARPMRWVEYPSAWTCEYCGNAREGK